MHVALIKLDIDGNKELSDSETAYLLFSSLAGQGLQRSDAESFRISFDRSDVEWLKGYCHLLQGLCDIALAYDWKDGFERAGHLFFSDTNTPYDFLTTPAPGFTFEGVDFRDVIAWVHLLNFKLIHPEGMKAALEHFQKAIKCSRKMWRLILSETDDDFEWLPNPSQTGVILGVQFTDEMIRAWHVALDECEDVLKGKKLIPFWRSSSRSVNLRAVFVEPRDIDVILWMQGTAAAPYLETGPISSPETWREIRSAFGSRFLLFSLWIN